MDRVFRWEEIPNIKIEDEKVVWWNEEEICIKVDENGKS